MRDLVCDDKWCIVVCAVAYGLVWLRVLLFFVNVFACVVCDLLCNVVRRCFFYCMWFAMVVCLCVFSNICVCFKNVCFGFDIWCGVGCVVVLCC